LTLEKPGALAEEFKRRMAAREFAKRTGEAPFSLDGGSEENGVFAEAGLSAEPGPPAETGYPAENAVSADIPPEVETMRRFFGGDIVEIRYSGAKDNGSKAV
jgi:hypothetical protein